MEVSWFGDEFVTPLIQLRFNGAFFIILLFFAKN